MKKFDSTKMCAIEKKKKKRLPVMRIILIGTQRT